MKRLLAWTVLALSCVSCTLLNPTTGEEQTGLPTAVTAGILRGIADDVELWDVNKDGVNTDQELVAIGLAAGQRLLIAWQQLNAEMDAARAAAEAEAAAAAAAAADPDREN